MRSGVLGVVLGCCLASTILARDLYVNNEFGRDEYDGSTPLALSEDVGPLRTIATALRRAERGDRVILAKTSQPYRESITLQGGSHSGTPRIPFQLIGNGAILDGTQPIPIDRWRFVQEGLYRYIPPRREYQMLYLDGKPVERVEVTGGEQLQTLKPRQWCLFQHAIYFCADSQRLPGSYELALSALQVGITLYEVRNVTVSDVIVQGFQLDGVNAHDGVYSTRLVSLNCRGNGRAGISIGGASRVRIESCLVGNNGAAQVRTEGFSHTELLDCDLLDNTAPRIVRDGGEIQEGGQK